MKKIKPEIELNPNLREINRTQLKMEEFITPKYGELVSAVGSLMRYRVLQV